MELSETQYLVQNFKLQIESMTAATATLEAQQEKTVKSLHENISQLRVRFSM
jgi:hypothetical protein